MAGVAHLFPVLARGSGRWAGSYTQIDPRGRTLDRYRVDSFSEFPEDGSADYRLSVFNKWPSGRETRIALEADYRNGRLEWRERLVGWMAEVDDRTAYLTFSYADDPSIRVCEMIQVSADGNSRARTWHWFRDDRLFQITLTQEGRVGSTTPSSLNAHSLGQVKPG